jgi:hypothetical protein
MSKTEFDAKASILSTLWMDYKTDKGFEDFLQYNDVGLPLSFAYTEGLIDFKNAGSMFVEETFDLLLATLDIEDTGFETLEDVLAAGTP